MKVCTDSCLFGAWMAEWLETRHDIKNMLDIGAGTGLLSLMLAQQGECKIDAIEIDSEAASQAKQNVDQSDFFGNVNVIHVSLQAYLPKEKYDFIFSNPPFFENDLKSMHAGKNAAKHDTQMNLNELFEFYSSCLTEDGFGAILMPFHRKQQTINILNENGLHLHQWVDVRQTNDHGYFRSILLFSKSRADETQTEEISIKNELGRYSDRFIYLLKDYYLHL
jgi:tRNA1Val (adenine37-N6)-methyltransferase